MPRFCRTLYDDNGRAIGIACGTRPNHRCSSCGHHNASKQCDYPVTRRNGKAGTCDRYLCASCAHVVGKNLDYCPAHFRASATPR